MAGLGETCSHIAAILFWLETATWISKETTCTSAPSLPKACLEVPYVTLEGWSKFLRGKKRKTVTPSAEWEATAKQVPTQDDMDEFFQSL